MDDKDKPACKDSPMPARDDVELQVAMKYGFTETLKSLDKVAKMQEQLVQSQKNTDKQIEKMGSRWVGKWGDFMESLVEGSLLKMLKERGIEVDQIFPNVKIKRNKKEMAKEYDLIAANGSEAVVVEVKSFLTAKDTDDFLKDGVYKFKEYLPIYKNHKLYGAVAYLKSKANAPAAAEKKGLFVIKAAKDAAGGIINREGFKPKVF